MKETLQNLPKTDAFADSPGLPSELVCSLTGQTFPPDRLYNLSPAGKPLLVSYDYEAIRKRVTVSELRARPPGLWRWRELLPVRETADIVSLGEVETPLLALPRLSARWGFHWLRVKDESRLPTASFKARGMTLAVSQAKALGIRAVAIPTNGNAGAALAAYAHRAGMTCHVFCPADTPRLYIEEIRFYGAKVEKVDGFINDCGRRVAEGVAAQGWFDVSTLKEPYRLEGKKTMGLELLEQLDFEPPDVIFYPTGGGTGLIGMWKAFEELEKIGWMGSKRPRLVAVQASGCAPIVRAWNEGAEEARPWTQSQTIATGIRVPAAVGDFLILRAVRASGGFCMAVSDESILESQRETATQEGLMLGLEGAATLAAARQALAEGRIQPSDRVVLFNCGTGLKNL